MANRPRGRQKNVTGASGSVHKRGDGIGSSGPVGRTDGYKGRKGQSYGSSSYGSQPPYGDAQNQQPFESEQTSGTGSTRGLFSGKTLLIILAAVLLLGGGGGGLLSGLFGNLFGGDSSGGVTSQGDAGGSSLIGNLIGGGSSSSGGGLDLGGLLSMFGGSDSGVTSASSWSNKENTGTLNRSVVSGARDKYTNLTGGGKDTVTVMIYMCGTDLESKSGMASADLQEMLDATIGSNVNVLVYTGGCTKWKNNMVSSSVNQIYRVTDVTLEPVKTDAGTASMTKPSTLHGFIDFCLSNYKSTRNILILWDHGGGSLSGYGYDEKHAKEGSMSLKGLQEALTGFEGKFDFIGFDACLMGTLETGLMLAPYADYLVGSEETEPGIGWYYTDFLTQLSKNTSVSTLDLGKTIVDTFVDVCATRCPGQMATLSLVDLAELSLTAPESLSEFAEDAADLIEKDYQTVSDARAGTREFATSSKIDQIDLVDFAYRLNTDDSKALAKTLLSAVKYNRTASCISNAYGISIYFPYRKASGVNSEVSTLEAIGLDDEYSDTMRLFAGMQSGGQAASTGSGSPLSSLLGSGSASSGTLDMSSIASLLGGGLFGRSLDPEEAAAYIEEHQFDAANLVWKNGRITLSEDQWKLVHSLALNVFFDDGEGFIDLGIDNVYELTEDGALSGNYDGTWLAIDDQPVAYYYMDTYDDGETYAITGRVPIMLNDARAELILVFDNEHPYGYVAGARPVYDETETETVAKGITELNDGDEIDFLCDYYTYEGEFSDTYYLGEKYTWHGQPQISNVYIDKDAAQATYLFTDIYNNEFWTPVLP